MENSALTIDDSALDQHCSTMIQNPQNVGSTTVPSQALVGQVNEELIAAIRKVQLPKFLKNRPDIWFFMIEAEFQASSIKSDATKYNATLRTLDPDTVQQITDILYQPPTENKYENLK